MISMKSAKRFFHPIRMTWPFPVLRASSIARDMVRDDIDHFLFACPRQI